MSRRPNPVLKTDGLQQASVHARAVQPGLRPPACQITCLQKSPRAKIGVAIGKGEMTGGPQAEVAQKDIVAGAIFQQRACAMIRRMRVGKRMVRNLMASAPGVQRILRCVIIQPVDCAFAKTARSIIGCPRSIARQNGAALRERGARKIVERERHD